METRNAVVLWDKLLGLGQVKRGCDRNPLKNGAPGEIRTPDHLVRSQVLYPAELRALCQGTYDTVISVRFKRPPEIHE